MNDIVLSDSLQSYLAKINRFPVLSPEEEFRLAERYYKYKDIEAAHRLVTSNLRYVVKIALEYRKYGCRLSDLIQEGNIGLMVAVDRFNPYKGYRLITYASWWIRSFIQEFIIRTKGLVRRSSRALKKKLFYRHQPPIPSVEGGDDPHIQHDADTGSSVPYEEADLEVNDLSLDTAIGSDDDRTTHLDMLPDPRLNQEEALAVKQEQAMVKKEVNNALACLNDRESFIVKNRLMTDKPQSLQALGDRLGITRERVRQIENEAIKKLRKNLSKKIPLPPSFKPSKDPN